jgi:hypothetical protein
MRTGATRTEVANLGGGEVTVRRATGGGAGAVTGAVIGSVTGALAGGGTGGGIGGTVSGGLRRMTAVLVVWGAAITGPVGDV